MIIWQTCIHKCTYIHIHSTHTSTFVDIANHEVDTTKGHQNIFECLFHKILKTCSHVTNVNVH